MKWASPPEFFARARADCAAASPRSLSISAITTFAPSSAKRSAVARPMPPPPPVMNATFSANRGMVPTPDHNVFAQHFTQARIIIQRDDARSRDLITDPLIRGQRITENLSVRLLFGSARVHPTLPKSGGKIGIHRETSDRINRWPYA